MRRPVVDAAGRGPRALHVALVTLAAIAVSVAAVAAYAHFELADREAFAHRVSSSLDDAAVRKSIAERTVSALSEQVSAQVLIAAPLLEAGVEAIVRTRQFRTLLDRVARQRHDALARGRTSVVFDIAPGVGALIADLRGLSPRLAAAIPPELEVRLLGLAPQQFERRTASVVAKLSDAWVWLGVLAIALIALAALTAAGAAGALAAVGIAVGGAGALTAAVVIALGGFVVRHASTALDLSEGLQRDALRALWDALLGDLRTAAIAAGVGGLVIAAVPVGHRSGRRTGAALRDWLRQDRPATRRALGAGLVALGAAALLEPRLALRAATIVAGLLAVYTGVVRLIGDRSREPAPQQEPESARRRSGATLRAAAVVGVVVLALAVTFRSVLPAPALPTPAASPPGCNGAPRLCTKAVNEVVFPTTHNSYAAADEPGWLFPNQRFGIARQLRDGIRGFLIDPHYGISDPARDLVRTPLQYEGSSRNKVVRELGPEAVRVADRSAGRIGVADVPSGPRAPYLCHTLCELGAEPLEPQLRLFTDFLSGNRGAVITLVVEPYITPGDFEAAMRGSGLLRYAAELHRDEPLPTLGDLVRRNKRVLVFAERDGGSRPWYMPAFSFVQDTPYRAANASEQRCDRYRGTPDSPLLLLNHWISTFPPSPRANRRIAGDVLRQRMAACERARELTPNLVAVDFYERSGVVAAANERNRR